MRGNYQVRFCGGRGAAMLFSPTHHPSRAVVIVMRLEDGGYVEKTFEGSDRVISPTFPTLELTAEQILNAGQ
jgi:Uma2 family endonuclease